MSGGAKLLVGVVMGGVLLMTAGVGLAAAAIVGGGTVAVDARDDDGTDVSVHAPAALIDLALFLIPDGSISLALEHSDVGNREELAEIERAVPALRDAWRELVDAPDFTLVEATGEGFHVQVEKRGSQLVIHFDGDDGDVNVTLPVHTVSRALAKI